MRLTAIPKGKPKKMTPQEKKKQKQELKERNAVEGRIGNAKQAFGLDQMKAKLKSTAATWISALIFVMNLSQITKGLF